MTRTKTIYVARLRYKSLMVPPVGTYIYRGSRIRMRVNRRKCELIRSLRRPFWTFGLCQGFFTREQASFGTFDVSVGFKVPLRFITNSNKRVRYFPYLRYVYQGWVYIAYSQIWLNYFVFIIKLLVVIGRNFQIVRFFVVFFFTRFSYI